MALTVGVRSPPTHPGNGNMKPDEMEAKLHKMTQLALELDEVRIDQARRRARERVLLRDDVVSCEIRPDGTLLSKNSDGSTTLRPAGWRGRA